MMLGSSDDIALTSLMVGMTIVVVGIIAHQWRRVRVAAYNARLKQLMIERGMSAAEIERVLRADGKLDAAGQIQRGVGIAIGRAFDADCCVDEKNAKGCGS